MSAGLVLVVVVAGAYLAAHLVFEWLARRFLIVSGAEYLLLGILIGPNVSNLVSASVVSSFAPFMVLALGWTGAVIGTQFHLPTLLRVRARYSQVAFLEALLTLVVVTAVMAVGLAAQFERPTAAVLEPAVTLGAIATTSSLWGIALITRRLRHRAVIVRQLEVAAAVDAFVGITAFGLLLCWRHAAPPGLARAPTTTEWAVITVAIGAVGGALFHLFLHGERKPDRLYVSLIGALTLASGAAAHLQLSPLLPTMLIGAILINTSRNPATIRDALNTVHRPLYYVLLVFAGAAWRPTVGAALLPVLLFLAIRTAAKMGGADLAARLAGTRGTLGPDWGRALLGQGRLATAIALNYLILDGAPLAEVVFTATVASVLLTDLASARLVASVVRQYRERRAARPLAGAMAGPPGAAPTAAEANDLPAEAAG
ncbi:MAG TPA: hypothetical protein VFS40_12905 [Gemmatimonadales bacterium]|nr:hypothetical protein [Gemmatimonadales bacterium]